MARVILIAPPQMKPVEPPLGIFRAAAALNRSGVSTLALDSSILFLRYVLERGSSYPRGRPTGYPLPMSPGAAFRSLRSWDTYTLHEGNSKLDLPLHCLDRVLSLYARDNSEGSLISLADSGHGSLSRMNSADLVRAALEPGCLPFADFYEAELDPLIRSEDPEVIGVSLTFLNQSLAGFSLMGWIRERFPGVRVVLGGALAACWGTERLGFAVEAGICMKVYEDRAEAGFARDLGANGPGIPGTRAWITPDYADFPEPDYPCPSPTLPLCLSHGCYWSKCRFCPEAGTKYDCMKKGEAVTQFERLAETFEALPPSRPGPDEAPSGIPGGFKGIVHLTDNAVSPCHLRALMNSPAVRDARLAWWGFTRFEPILEEPDAARKLAESGCRMLELGLETASQPLLDAMGKGTNAARCGRVIRNLGQAGIKSFIYIMAGFPTETADDRARTVEFLREHEPHICGINIALMNLPRKGALETAHREVPDTEGDGRGEISKVMPFGKDDDLTLYLDFVGSASGHRTEVRKAVDRIRKTPGVREICARTPKFTKSNHSVYMCMANPAGEW